MSTTMNRRTFLSRTGACLGIGLLGPTRLTTYAATPSFRRNPFSLGVASGDPRPDSVVLWTRLAPDPVNGGGMPPASVEVDWQIAEDERLTKVVRAGRSLATPELAHSVHVEVDGLSPGRWYWYRFRVAGHASAVGRTRTTPALGAPADKLRFAFASCQSYEAGYYTSLRHMASEGLDLVIHLGDYIYEGAGRDGGIRKHIGAETESLDDYRNRYALYRTDPDLQLAHAACPWLVTWDDHEVDNNYAAEISEENAPVEGFLRRRAAAYQAYYEHMPLRLSSLPAGPHMQLYGRVPFGNLAEFFVLDTRQYRSPLPCGGRGTRCAEAFDPRRTLLGGAQEQWLFKSIEASQGRWNVLAQQVMMAHLDRKPGPEVNFDMDKWDGYETSRARLLGHLMATECSNPIVLTGDIHSNWVADLKADFGDERSPTVAAEFVGTSLSSSGDGFKQRPETPQVLSENPFFKFFNAQRGYVRCEVTPELWRSDFRIVEFVTAPNAPISTLASFVVENGKPGIEVG